MTGNLDVSKQRLSYASSSERAHNQQEMGIFPNETIDITLPIILHVFQASLELRGVFNMGQVRPRYTEEQYVHDYAENGKHKLPRLSDYRAGIMPGYAQIPPFPASKLPILLGVAETADFAEEPG